MSLRSGQSLNFMLVNWILGCFKRLKNKEGKMHRKIGNAIVEIENFSGLILIYKLYV